ncbi:MAG: hypothetical protein JXB35_15170 [Anaerolineae bacterium]|nr:hypothetical protein [Anaerolineae bacterium]
MGPLQRGAVLGFLVILLLGGGLRPAQSAPVENPAPPDDPVKLIFIHHSTGGNWLADPNDDQPYGGLGRALMDNNYFVSATNYGWGPEGIGDRTDIVNWPEWFLGPERDRIMQAVYTENGQNIGDFGAWPRTSDPGGENMIIMFKSCFPKSDLDGKPGDAPLAEPNDWDYTVANARAVYIALLDYFATRPDKLFIVITAPPLQRSETSRARAANARAFNTWLVNDWLQGYPYANVAVFDYYNVLTDPDNHHRWNGRASEHIQAADTDYAAYPSGDSHPSTEGHHKATEEFVPLLNAIYNRWQAAGPAAPPEAPTPTLAAEPPERPEDESQPPAAVTGLVDDFEADFLWEGDGGEGATFECAPGDAAHSGATALHLQYAIPAGGWVGCGRYYDTLPDWRGADGISLWQRAGAPGLRVTLMAFAGDPEAPTPFQFDFLATETWEPVAVAWTALTRAEWADEGGLAVFDPARVTGIYLLLEEGEGHLWVDDVALFSGEAAPPEEIGDVPLETDEPVDVAADAPASGGGGLCASAPLLASLTIAGLVLGRRHKGAGA